MTALSSRGSQLAQAASRAQIVSRTAPGGSDQPPLPPAIGVAMSGAMKHGGLYTLADPAMTSARLDAIMLPWIASQPDPTAARGHVANMAVRGAAIPSFFFYHICPTPYKLHARLISYLTYPNLHLRSPLAVPPDTEPHSPEGKTFSITNTPSPAIPAAFTFVGQFIDHDLTLNAMNLFSIQNGTVMSQASPLLDLDNVYGARLDDPPQQNQLREIPMVDGYFRLRKIADKQYDVCREDKGAFGQHCSALIGDKRNDDNQIVLQVHILIMRLHNAFRHHYGDFARAQQQTILHWQAFVLHHYLPSVVDPGAIAEILQRLAAQDQLHSPLVHRPGRTICGGCTLGMPHEFAIGFRFGHSQLRSFYELNPGHAFRLFDSLSNGEHDLQGGKCLSADRVVDWPFFLQMNGSDASHPSNLIDTQVNQVVFDLPESTIPDDIRPVSNLPFRNLVRSDNVGLCSGEDVARIYEGAYGSARVAPLAPDDVEPDPNDQPLFTIDTQDPAHPHDPPPFKTPLWYYVLREAEVDRQNDPQRGGRLGRLGSYLVAEVILSAIWYAPVSLLDPKPAPDAPPGSAPVQIEPFGDPAGDPTAVDLLSIAQFVNAHDHSHHGCADDACAANATDCALGNPPIP